MLGAGGAGPPAPAAVPPAACADADEVLFRGVKGFSELSNAILEEGKETSGEVLEASRCGCIDNVMSVCAERL
jgi:hypothetical protein